MEEDGEIEFSVRYPFTQTAKRVIQDQNIQLSDRVVELAVGRLKNAVQGKKPSKSTAIHKSQKIEEIGSYAAARMLTGYMRNNYVTERFAVYESKRARNYLESEKQEWVETVANEFGITSKEKESIFEIPLPVYLNYSPRSIEYRLINRKIDKGFVPVKKEERRRLIEEAVRKHVLHTPIVKNPTSSIRKAASILRSSFTKVTYGKRISLPRENPPCIQKLLESVKKHENLPHSARWFLAVYLINKGMSNESLVALFSNFPDYSPKTTKYQVEHARKRGYTVPSCSTVLTHGLCVSNCNVGTPSNWGRKRGKKK